MKQLKVPKEIEITIDFSDPGLPASVSLFHPVMFQEGNSFCCLLGPDTTQGIFGCGFTQQEAIEEWDAVLQERINSSDENDSVLQYIKSIQNQSLANVG